jgi:hypothetical protein
VLLAYQVDPASGDLALAGETVIPADGIALADARLLNPFRPLLLTVSAADGALLSAQLLPFPSLCRGGAHYAEACAAGAADGPAALSRHAKALLDQRLAQRAAGSAPVHVAVSVSGATSAEPIFQRALRDWLGADMNVALSAADLPEDAAVAAHLSASLTTAVSPEGPPRLHLPADTIPSIAALVAAEWSPDPAPLCVVADETWEPLWLIQPPSDQQRRQPGSIAFRATTPPADALLMQPLPAGRSAASIAGPAAHHDRSVTAVIPCGGSGPGLPEALLESIRLQSCGADIDVTLVGSACNDVQAALARLFPGRHTVIHAEPDAWNRSINRAAARSDSRFLLILDPCALLHDPRTVKVLCALASSPGVATASCTAIAEIRTPEVRRLAFLAGGYTCDPGTDGEEAIFSLPDSLNADPRRIRPVAANTLHCLMVRNDVWQKLGGLDSADESEAAVSLALRALRMGFGHLCTADISCTVLSGHAEPRTLQRPVRRMLDAADLDALARHAGFLSGLRG